MLQKRRFAMRQTGSRSRGRLVVAVTDSQSLILIRGQLDAARSFGFEVAVISSPPPNSSSVAFGPGIHFEPVAMARGIDVGADVRALAHLVGFFLRWRPDIVNAGTPKAGLLCMIAATIAGVPVKIHTLRGLRFETMSGVGGRIVKETTRFTCCLADRVVCVSPSLRERALELGVTVASRSVALGAGSSNGVDVDHFRPSEALRTAGRRLRARLGIPADAPLLAFVGRLAVDKGLVELESAWRSLRESWPDLHLVVAGPTDSTDPLPDEVLRSFRQDTRVHLVGHVDDPRPLYATMDVLVLPTYREGFSNVLLEAASMERPAVATRTTGCVDPIVHDETGLLVAPRDSQELRDALERYAADPKLRMLHGKRARSRAKALFRREVVWQNLHSEYLRSLDEAKTNPHFLRRRWKGQTT